MAQNSREFEVENEAKSEVGSESSEQQQEGKSDIWNKTTEEEEEEERIRIEVQSMLQILGDLSCKVENARRELTYWNQYQGHSIWREIHIQSKKLHLRRLMREKMAVTEGLNRFYQTGECFKPFEIYTTTDTLKDTIICNVKLEEQIEHLLKLWE